MKPFNSPGLVIAACCLAGLAPAVRAQSDDLQPSDFSRYFLIPRQTDDWTRHFRVGALVGLNINANFHTKGTFGISGNDPAKGIYDDGYVKTDDTGNAGGLTSNWGYNNASQYDAANHILQMHAVNSFSTSDSGSTDSKPFPGFELAYGGYIWQWKSARVGWELGFGLLPISLSQNLNSSASISRTTYNYNIGVLDPPAPPYQGGPSGGGAIPSKYDSTSQDTFGGQVTGTQSLDVTLYTIRLGPSLYWDLSEHVGMSLGAGPAIGIVAGDYSYNETITDGANIVLAQNHGQINGVDVVYGGYVNGAVMYHINDNGKIADLYLSVQYMPMQNASISGGGREAQLNLNGQVYISAGINWPF